MNATIRIFCKLKENWEIKGDKIKLKDYILHFDNYLIIIIPSLNFIKLSKINSILPFLYSDEQIINIEKSEDKNKYNLKFNFL